VSAEACADATRQLLRRRDIVTPVSERFETDMGAGYPEDARGVTLGSPMREGEVLCGVRTRHDDVLEHRPRSPSDRTRLPGGAGPYNRGQRR